MPRFTVATYLDDGRVFEYDIEAATEDAGASSAREHAAAIVQGGYRHNDGTVFEHYPPHRILKVKVAGAIPTLYPDRVRGT